MKPKTKRQLRLGAVIVAALFVLYLIVFYNITPSATAGAFITKQHDFAVDLVTNVTDNYIFYLFVLAILVILGVYAYANRKKGGTRRRTRR